MQGMRTSQNKADAHPFSLSAAAVIPLYGLRQLQYKTSAGSLP